MAQFTGEQPDEPHLVLMTGLATGKAIPVGALLYIRWGASMHETVPVVLSGVSKRGIELKCACGQAACTRTWVGRWQGQHPALGSSR
jgi:hypothetical protein